MNLSDNGGCFACGPNNPIGLHLRFRFEGDEYVTEYVPAPEHQGFAGITHGGLLATVLDEVMARGLWAQGERVVTAELKVSLRQPARVGEALTIRGRLLARRGRLFHCEARAVRGDGTLVAVAEGKLLRV
ncbi:MAG: PaaI family thioesterase [Armatimonadota bacterium]|nr:PaaI family thioesterase [Armatimonadota bacterium]